MSCIVTKDPDNTWYYPIYWSNWFAQQVDEMGGTYTITASLWFPDPAISEDGNAFDDTTKVTTFHGSGGVAGTNYNLLNRISFTSTSPTLVGRTFTEDRTIQIRIKEK